MMETEIAALLKMIFSVNLPITYNNGMGCREIISICRHVSLA
jgi:hypothetical protein